MEIISLENFNTRSSGPLMNQAGFELTEANNDSTTPYATMFVGPERQTGIDGLITMFTPSSSATVGALNTAGEWRKEAHRPMMAAAPDVAAGSGAFTLTSIFDPTLWGP